MVTSKCQTFHPKKRSSIVLNYPGFIFNRFAVIKYYMKLLISELLSDPQDVLTRFIKLEIPASCISGRQCCDD